MWRNLFLPLIMIAVLAQASYALAQSGPRPILIEWDTDVPDWPVLAAEAARAADALARLTVPA